MKGARASPASPEGFSDFYLLGCSLIIKRCGSISQNFPERDRRSADGCPTIDENSPPRETESALFNTDVTETGGKPHSPSLPTGYHWFMKYLSLLLTCLYCKYHAWKWCHFQLVWRRRSPSRRCHAWVCGCVVWTGIGSLFTVVAAAL